METTGCPGTGSSTKYIQSRPGTKEAASDSSSLSNSKEKKILPGRRQQRHSTEIGLEYHRWWAVRNAVGFETNEHIAGLLLDGFHALLEQIVLMCGGPTYQPDAEQAGKSNGDTVDGTGGATLSTSGTAEDDEEFGEYKNAVMFYCDTLWRMCGQQDSRLQELDNASQPMQDFICRLMGYLKIAKGKAFSLNYKKKKFKQASFSSTSNKERELHPAPPGFLPGQSMAAGNIQLSNPSLQYVPTSTDVFNRPHQQTWLHGRLAYVPNSGTYAFTPTSESCVDSRKTQSEREIQALNDYDKTSNYAEFDVDERRRGLPFNQTREPNPASCQESYVTSSAQAYSLSENMRKEIMGRPKSEEQRLPKDEPSQYTRHVPSSQKSDVSWDVDAYEGKLESKYSQSVELTHDSNDFTTQLPQYFDPANPSSHNLANIHSMRSASRESSEHKSHSRTTRQETASQSSKSSLAAGPLKSLLRKPVSVNPYSQSNFVDTKLAAGDEDQNECKQENLNVSDLRVNQEEENQNSAQCREKLGIASQKSSKTSIEKETVCPSDEKIERQSKGTNTSYENSTKMDAPAFSSRKATNESKLVSQKCSRPNTNNMNAGPRVPPSENLQPIQPALYPQADHSTGPSLTTPLGAPVILYPAPGLTPKDTSLASLSSLVQNIVYNSHGTVFKPLSLVPGLTTSAAGVTQIPLSQENSSTKTATSVPIFSTHISSNKPTLFPLYISPAGVGTLGIPKSNMKSGAPQSPTLKIVSPTQLPLLKPHDLAKSKSSPNDDNQQIAASSSANELKITDVRSCAEDDFTNEGHNKAAWSAYEQNEESSSRNNNVVYPECRGLSGEKLDFDSLVPVKNSSLSQHKGSNEQNTRLEHLSVTASEGQLVSKKRSDQNQDQSSLSKTFHSKVESSDTVNSMLSSHLQHSRVLASLRSAFLEKKKCAATSQKSADTTVIPNSSQKKDISGMKKTSEENSSSSHSKTPRWRRLVCSTCQLIFFSGTDLLVHRYEQHSHVCKECDGRFLSKTCLEEHKASDHPEIIVCQHCRFHTFSKTAMEKHLWDIHGFDSKIQDLMDNGRGKKTAERNCEEQLSMNREVNNNSETAHPDTKSSSNKSEKSNSLDNRSLATGEVSTYDTNKDELADRMHNRQSILSRNGVQQNGDLGTSKTQSRPAPPSVKEAASQEKNSSNDCKANHQSYLTKHNLVTHQPPCFGAAFPSFSSQPTTTTPTPAACDSVTSLYSQEIQHGPLEATSSLLSLSEQQQQQQIQQQQQQYLSENDEPPQLVIDTGEQAEERKEDSSEDTRWRSPLQQDQLDNRSGSWDQDQPLCLVVHNRQHRGTLKSKKSLTNRGDASLASTNCIPPTHLKNKQSNQKLKGRYVDHTIQSAGGDSFENAGTAVQAVSYTEAERVPTHDIPTDKLECCESTQTMDAKKKLVMKISLKRSAIENPWEDEHMKKKRKKRRRRKLKASSTALVDTTAVEIDNPEVDNEGKCLLVDSADEALAMRWHVESFEDLGSLRQDNPDHVEDASVSDGEVLSTSHLNCTDTEPSEKILSLRERHGMSSLPPKKRNFRKAPKRHERNATMPSIPNGEVNSRAPDVTTDVVESCENNTSTRSNPTADPQHAVRGGKELRSHSKRLAATEPKRQPVQAEPEDTENKLPTHTTLCGEDQDSFNSVTSTQITKEGTETELDPPTSQQVGRYSVLECSATSPSKCSEDTPKTKAHSQAKMIICSVDGCQKEFTNKRKLRQHIATDHKGKTRKYVCSWPGCNKNFFTQTHLRVHNLTHTGEKPIACQNCDYRCRQQAALLWHMRKHGVFHKASSENSGGDGGESNTRASSLRVARQRSNSRSSI